MSFLNKFLGKLFGSKAEKDLKLILPIVQQVNHEYAQLKNVSSDELRSLSLQIKADIRNSFAQEAAEIDAIKLRIENEDPDFEIKEELYKEIEVLEKKIKASIEEKLTEHLPKAFAIVRETARRFKTNEKIIVKATDFDRFIATQRTSVEINNSNAIWHNSWMAGGNKITWDMEHYDVQLIGGIALHMGKIAEMGTGEGKTLVATLPVFLNALAGRGVHIVTVNDYLAKRDSEWMGPIYEFHGLEVDCIDRHEPNSDARRKAYMADITFGTNNEFGFDYLRDNMSQRTEDLVQRPHNYAIVDEVDSVLIDDARTPLIISGPIPKGDIQLFDELKPAVEKLMTAQRNLVNKLIADAKNSIKSGKKDEGALLLLKAYKGLPKNSALIKFLSEEGMKALLLKTEDIYLADNAKRMPEVTEHLYFVIDEKHRSVELTDKGTDLISTGYSDSSFFILPDIGSEVAEIEKSNLPQNERLQVKDQLLADYAVKSERLHTIHQLLKAYALFEKDVDYVVMDNKVKIVDEQTGRILEGRRYSDGLHQAIEAKERVKVEAATQTFATITLQNYFRMYNKLAGMTGTAETEAGEFWDIYKLDVVVIPTNRAIARDDREDLIYKTRREKYNAVIDQIQELVQQGRPVLVGTTSVEISELLSRMLTRKGIKHSVLNAKLHQREADIVADAGKSSIVTIATNMAGRGTDIKLSAEVKKAGGLAIIGTERHESRRVDRQLRGRAGRQGDPGSSQFFVSLEDDLMRMFGSERIAGIMDRIGLKDGEVIQHSMITKSIERAQKKVEENNFGIRKRLLEYDDVMNSQREVIYTRRRNALNGDKISIDISNMMVDVCQSIVDSHHGNSSFEEYQLDLIRMLSIDSPIDQRDYAKMSNEDITERLSQEVHERYKRKIQAIAEESMPVIRSVYEKQSHQYDNILIPFTDGVRIYNIVVNLKKAYETGAKEVVRAFEKALVLLTIDDAWKEHLREMDDLKQSVQNAAYEQKDPLLIYKFEAYELFRNMLDRINKSIVSLLLKSRIHSKNPEEVKSARQIPKLDMSKYKTRKDEFETRQRQQLPDEGNQQQGQPPREQQKIAPVRVEPKVGRNDDCPCGSGKKYKHCHGKDIV